MASDNTAAMWQVLSALPHSTPVSIERGPTAVILRVDVAQQTIRAPLLALWLESPEHRHQLLVAVRLFRRRVQAALHGRLLRTPIQSSARHRSANARPGYRGYGTGQAANRFSTAI